MLIKQLNMLKVRSKEFRQFIFLKLPGVKGIDTIDHFGQTGRFGSGKDQYPCQPEGFRCGRSRQGMIWWRVGSAWVAKAGKG